MKSENLQKFGIVIIESLPENEKKTGYDLHSTIIQYKTFEFPDLASDFYDVNNKIDFFWLLNELARKAVEENYFFVLHMEMHGFNDGIELKNGEEVTWGEMIPYFQEINIHYQNYLLIVLGICEGASIIKYTNPAERAPFRALISSEKKIYDKDFIPGFEEFYKHFFFEFDAVEALEKYNSVITDSKDKLLFVSAEYLFDQITDIKRPTADKQKLRQIYSERLFWDFPDLKHFPKEYTEKYIDNEIEKAFGEVRTKKDYFLMKDLDV